MKISIVTISFNQAEFLEACIRSVINQDYHNIEYIVVDPGSTDGSRAIIKKFAQSIDTVILTPDNGPADGLNNGFNVATGDIYGYINADDILLPGSLSRISDYFAKHVATDVVSGHGILLDRSGTPIKQLFSTRWGLKPYAYGAVTTVQQATFFRREAYLRCGGFNADNRTCWDGELLVDLALSGSKFGLIHEHLGGFRLYDSSISGSGHLSRHYVHDFQRIREKILGRPFGSLDQLLCMLYRMGKYVGNPYQTYLKMIDYKSTPTNICP